MNAEVNFEEAIDEIFTAFYVRQHECKKPSENLLNFLAQSGCFTKRVLAEHHKLVKKEAGENPTELGNKFWKEPK